MKINLSTIKDVNDFVNICREYNDEDIIVKQDRYVIDGKSILGIFSLNLLEKVEVIIESKNENSEFAFYKNIQKWKVNDMN